MNWLCWLNRPIKWVAGGAPLCPRFHRVKKEPEINKVAYVYLCKSWGIGKPTYLCIGSICYYCLYSAAADVTQLWISIYEGAEDYVLNIFSIHPAENSADFQGRPPESNLNASKAASFLSCCPPHRPASPAPLPVPPLPWEFIHPQPPQEMIVFCAFRVAVCVTANYKITTARWTDGI